MIDDIARARRSAAALEDACARHGSANRRWTEASDDARAQWDDAAGRALQQRWFDPYLPLIEGVATNARAAVEGQRTALDGAGRAVDAAMRATDAVVRATAAIRQAQSHGATARTEIGTALSESGSTRQLATDITARVASLG